MHYRTHHFRNIEFAACVGFHYFPRLISASFDILNLKLGFTLPKRKWLGVRDSRTVILLLIVIREFVYYLFIYSFIYLLIYYLFIYLFIFYSWIQIENLNNHKRSSKENQFCLIKPLFNSSISQTRRKKSIKIIPSEWVHMQSQL